VPGAAYKKGDVIDQKYVVCGVLGAGGFGVVYLVYARETNGVMVYAMKAIREGCANEAQTRELFRKEAGVWVDMERHPYLVRAYFIEEVAGRLFIAMEYIAPGEDGLNTLEGYLRQRPPDLAQSLRWAVQICHGMEYAYSKGVRCHRDIKPANIMIDSDKTVRITDFGLAGLLGPSRAMPGIRLSVQQGTAGPSGHTMEGTGFGTPTHMPPEQFTDAASCDERSDIYSFGIVLFQMASGGRLPFLTPLPTEVAESETAPFWREMHRLHSKAPLPKLNSPLFSVIKHCLEKKADRRYRSFKELRGDLEQIFHRQTGESISPPELEALEAWEWGNKGKSLDNLGSREEAILCFDRALDLDPLNAVTWNNKGNCLDNLGRFEDAVRCYDKAIGCMPRLAGAWYNKGRSLHKLGRDEAVRCFGTALELDPGLTAAWYNKGNILHRLGRYDEALPCVDKALELQPRDPAAWSSKGLILKALGRCDEAIRCYDKALGLDPHDAAALNNKGSTLARIGRHEEAIQCFDSALELDARDAGIWYNRGCVLDEMGRHEEAIRSYDRALALDPRYTLAWGNKAESLSDLGRFEEAIRCIDKVLEVEPRDAGAWLARALANEGLGQREAAVRSYRQFIELAPPECSQQVLLARQRVRGLEGK